jgi:hypothetical protein
VKGSSLLKDSELKLGENESPISLVLSFESIATIKERIAEKTDLFV